MFFIKLSETLIISWIEYLTTLNIAEKNGRHFLLHTDAYYIRLCYHHGFTLPSADIFKPQQTRRVRFIVNNNGYISFLPVVFFVISMSFWLDSCHINWIVIVFDL